MVRTRITVVYISSNGLSRLGFGKFDVWRRDSKLPIRFILVVRRLIQFICLSVLLFFWKYIKGYLIFKLVILSFIHDMLKWKRWRSTYLNKPHVPNSSPLYRQRGQTVLRPLFTDPLHGWVGKSIVGLSRVTTPARHRREHDKPVAVLGDFRLAGQSVSKKEVSYFSAKFWMTAVICITSVLSVS